MRFRTRTFITAATFAATCTGSLLATDTPCEERVASDCHYASVYPFNTIAKLFVEDPDDGSLGGYGTGFLVGPHCALTNGHCVYKRNQQRYFIKDIHLMPGACRGSTGWYSSEFGTREALHKRTNNKYADLDYSPTRAVDYGALQFVCPFEEITTFMPLCFGYESDWAHMAGYPSEDTPDASLNRNQWIAYGDVIETHDRWVRYDAHSTGGASGSPVWNWRANEALVDVFAINSTHWNECDGGGPRLMWQNEDLIRSWMRWEPSFGEKLAAGCPEFFAMPFPHLFEFFQANPNLRLDPQSLRIENPVAPPPTGPSRRYMQVIENGFYEWLEYDLQPGNPETNRLVLLLAAPGMQLPGQAWFPGMPFDPQQQGWLSVEKAAALYSGSASRASAPLQGIGHTLLEAMDLDVMQPEPDLGDFQPDVEPDGDGPADDQDACLGDLNGDGKVDGADMGLMLGAWGTDDPRADLDGNGDVNGADLGLLLGAWGVCP